MPWNLKVWKFCITLFSSKSLCLSITSNVTIIGKNVQGNPSRLGCISYAFLRRLIQRLRDISKRDDLQISETPLKRLIKDVSSKTSLRSLRFSQRGLWVASETEILGLQTKAFFGYLIIYLRVFSYLAKSM